MKYWSALEPKPWQDEFLRRLEALRRAFPRPMDMDADFYHVLTCMQADVQSEVRGGFYIIRLRNQEGHPFFGGVLFGLPGQPALGKAYGYIAREDLARYVWITWAERGQTRSAWRREDFSVYEHHQTFGDSPESACD